MRRLAHVALPLLVLALALLAAGSGVASAQPSELAPGDPTLGEVREFHFLDWAGAARTVTAVARYVGPNCVVFVPQDRPGLNVLIGRLGPGFNDTVYPRLTEAFGPDAHGEAGAPAPILLLYHFGSDDVYGFFQWADLVPQAGDTSQEIVYLNLDVLAADPDGAEATAAHEFSHLLFAYRSFADDPDPGGKRPPLWVQEGVAMEGELVAGYKAHASEKLDAFEDNPAVNLTRWSGNSEDYGAGYAFVTFLAEQGGPGTLRALAGEHQDGIDGIEHVLQLQGSTDTFASVFDRWVLANSLNGHQLPPPLVFYAGLDVAVRPAEMAPPLPRIGTAWVKNYGAAYLELPAADPASSAKVVVDGQDGAPLQAALLSWDSSGSLVSRIDPVLLSAPANGGTVVAPAGYDRHTLVLWSRGVEGADALYSARWSTGIADEGVQFLDVDSSHPFFSGIDKLRRQRVIEGKEVEPGSGLWEFQPGAYVTRAQFAKIVVGAIGAHTAVFETTDATFPDVPYNGQLYPFDYVEEAVALGIVNGLPDGRFWPNKSISRIQLAQMIVRAGGGALVQPPADYSDGFVDVPDYAKEAVRVAHYNLILSGKSLTSFDPYGNATRGHVAKMTANLLDVLSSTP